MKTDYLIIGAGAMGMAFADVILHESDASVVIVDRRDKPGGHWNDAYPFVRLHQPSAFYGVNSRPLGRDLIDQSGWNEGLYELASGAEVCAYFDAVMREDFLTSGRVTFLPNHEYADGAAVSRITGEQVVIDATTVVDASYMDVRVPSTTPPGYQVDAAVDFTPVNGLPKLAATGRDYVIVGAGKTGIDACLWLLANGVDPAQIRWIMPRDSWLLNRRNIQPGVLFGSTVAGLGTQIKAAAESSSVQDLFERVEAAGQLMRIDRSRWPTMYRCATVTEAELDQLRRIEGIVRMGHVSTITAETVTLDEGTIAISGNTLVVDCSADGLERRPVKPVFDGNRLTLQPVRTCQQVFSAAFIAHVALTVGDESERNQLCTVVPHPDSHIDFMKTALSNSVNGAIWSQYPEIQTWLQNARLDGFSQPGSAAPTPMNEEGRQVAITAAEKLQRYIAEADGKS